LSKEFLGSLELNRIYQRDCLSDGGMALIPDKSIDMILCDLPYGTTACKWDTIIPFDKLWAQYERVIKDSGAIVLTASQPFTSSLISSNRFRDGTSVYRNRK
jgi:site-specific DNA-methyltransferase (adenine-specific)